MSARANHLHSSLEREQGGPSTNPRLASRLPRGAYGRFDLVGEPRSRSPLAPCPPGHRDVSHRPRFVRRSVAARNMSGGVLLLSDTPPEESACAAVPWSLMLLRFTEAWWRPVATMTFWGVHDLDQLRGGPDCGGGAWVKWTQPGWAVSIGVVIVGAHEQDRTTLTTRLDGVNDIEVMATADDASTALLQTERVGAQVVIFATPLSMSLPDVCEALHALVTEPKVLVLDRYAIEDMLLHAIEAGVDGYTSEVDGLETAVRRVVHGEAVVPPAMLGSLLRRLIQRRREAENAAERLAELTRREREVLHLLVGGLDQNGIATALFISPETARTHVQRVLRKLEVHSRREAIALVAQTGLAKRLEAMVDRSAQ